MELGLTTFAKISDPSLTAGGRLREVVEEAKFADELGLDVYGIDEHHRPNTYRTSITRSPCAPSSFSERGSANGPGTTW